MARLILLNGPPGIGKSTIARRYVAERPLAFCLDLDGIRRLIGQWDRHEQESGLLARAMALAMARVHLGAGHDVVVPQYVARPPFADQLAALTPDFLEIVLLDDRADAARRYAARADDPVSAVHHAEAHALIGKGYDAMYDALLSFLPSRPRARVVRTSAGDLEGSYAALLAALL